MTDRVPTRKEVTIWLAKALCHVPSNLIDLSTGMMPPQWVKDAKRECNRIGISFVNPKDRKKKKKKQTSNRMMNANI